MKYYESLVQTKLLNKLFLITHQINKIKALDFTEK